MEDPSLNLVVIQQHLKELNELLARANPSDEDLRKIWSASLKIAVRAMTINEWALERIEK